MKQVNLLLLKLNCVFLLRLASAHHSAVVPRHNFRNSGKKIADLRFLWLNEIVFVRIQYKVRGFTFPPITVSLKRQLRIQSG